MGGWLVFVTAIHVVATRRGWSSPREMQHALQLVVDPIKYALLHALRSTQRFAASKQTDVPRVNGRPPADAAYRALVDNQFADWALEVCGLVEEPLRLTLEDLRAMERQTQVTRHNCIQGWSYVAEWTGVPLRAVLDRCKPLPRARYVM